MSNNIINKVKPVEVGCVVWVDGYKSKITKITDDGVVGLVLDEGLITEFHYECLLGDITLDNDGDYVLDTEFVPVVGDVIRINYEEYVLITIDDSIVTTQRGDEIRHYSIHDVNFNIINGYWISPFSQEVFSPTVKRKLKVYEAQDNVYLYNSLDELKEIYELLGEPPIQGFYGTDSYENLIEILRYGYGLVHHWENYDSERDFMYKHIKVIQGGYIKDEL